MSVPSRSSLVVLAALVGGAAHADDVLRLDGIPDEALWAEARVFEDFRVTVPYTLAAPTHPTRALLRALPEGLVVAFVVSQPAGTPRLKPRAGRDAEVNADRVNFSVDFDGDGRLAYNFMVTLGDAIGDEVISNENSFNADWDGNWDYALHEATDHWSVEMRIPWSVAAMRGSQAPLRTIGVHFDRVLASRNERSAASAASFTRPRYVSEFTRIEVEQQSARGVLSVVPYVSVPYDLIDRHLDHRAGLDLFWKPSGDFQLSATLNPDFGQVEADDLVVDFSAIEVFFSDKRPFFTENQGIFDLRTPDEGRLVYTRRIGGPADDDGHAADIDVALKLNGSAGGFDYGTLAAVEAEHADDVGRAFFVQRLQRDVGTLNLGWLTTWADRPFLDRRALVNAVDATWRPDPRWLLRGQVLESRIEDEVRTTGDGAWFRAFYTPNPTWQHELEVTHFSHDLDFNDVGYQRRADYNELEWTTTHRRTDFADDDWRRSVTWAVEPQLRANDRGDRLPATLYLVREVNLRGGGVWEGELVWSTSGADDLISRGNGLVVQPPRLDGLWQGFSSPRIGQWSWLAGAFLYQDGYEDYTLQLEAELRYHARDDLDIGLMFIPRWSRDWLLWRGDTRFASYTAGQRHLEVDLNWYPGRRHEVRLKAQWLGIVADDPVAYRLGGSGHLVRSDDVHEDFTVNRFGLQLRYRYAFGPRRELYVVYARGGDGSETLGLDDPHRRHGLGDLLGDAPGLRDADQILVKLRWEI